MDPYRSFRFRLLWQGQTVAGLGQVSNLSHSRSPPTFRQGGDPSAPRALPGQAVFGPITLHRGMTRDTVFESWARQVWNPKSPDGAQAGQGDLRRDFSLEAYDEAGQRVAAYDLFRCWPSEYVALPDLDAGANSVAIQTLVLQTEGWARRADVAPPPPPAY